MSIRIAAVFAVIVIASAPAWAQLHLIVGTANTNQDEQFASALYKVDVDGAVRKVTDLVPQDPGTQWIALSYELRKAVILPQGLMGGDPPIVLDLDTATVVKRCSNPSATIKDSLTKSLFRWLSDVPGRGATFEWYVPLPQLGQGLVQGMDIDPSVPCEKSFLEVSPTEMQYMMASGTAGVGQSTSPDTPPIGMNEVGTLERQKGYPSSIYQVPADLRKGLGFAFARIVVNNSQMMVVGLVADEESTPRFLVLRKRDKTWHVIPSRNWSAWCLRGFGNFVAIAETTKGQRSRSAAAPRSTELSPPPMAESAGRAEWRSRETRLGPNIADSLADARVIYPGRLHLFDVETQKMFTIDTKQGDSEILLVDDGAVYYRVSDRLYSAPVTAGGIGTARLVATDEVIGDAHWAFIKH